MTPGTWDDLAGRLYGVLIAVEDRLGSERAGEAHHYIEVGEYGLALDEIAGVLGLAPGGHHQPGTRGHAGAGSPDEDRRHHVSRAGVLPVRHLTGQDLLLALTCHKPRRPGHIRGTSPHDPSATGGATHACVRWFAPRQAGRYVRPAVDDATGRFSASGTTARATATAAG